MNDILQAYDQCRATLADLSDEHLGRGAGWVVFTEKRLSLEHWSVPTVEALYEQLADRLAGHEAEQGWVLWQRNLGLEVLTGTGLLERLKEQQAPLDAELGAESFSMALLYRNAAWHVTWMREVENDGQIMPACDEWYVSQAPNINHLKYRVYWQHDVRHGYRPHLSRFLGFANRHRADHG